MMDIVIAIVCAVFTGAWCEADCGALLVAGVDVKVESPTRDRLVEGSHWS